MTRLNSQSGFTLMEIVVATAVFATVVITMLGLFDYTLKINRRVQALRQVAQGTRNFTEALTREIRNGRVDYNNPFSQCDPNQYSWTTNQMLAIIAQNGDQLCFYLDGEQNLHVLKNVAGNPFGVDETINPEGFKIVADTFRFRVRPAVDPTVDDPFIGYSGIQPVVTIIAQFEVQTNSNQPPTIIPYQTSISTDIYDIPPHQS